VFRKLPGGKGVVVLLDEHVKVRLLPYDHAR